MSALFRRISLLLRFSRFSTPPSSAPPPPPPHHPNPPTLSPTKLPFPSHSSDSASTTSSEAPSNHTVAAGEAVDIDTAGKTADIAIPDPPTDCCMSGCANCVWITYASELAAIYKDGGKASESVMKAIDDPSLKIFLNLELKEILKDVDIDSHHTES